MTLLGIVAALVPLAAMEGGGGPALARAAEVPAVDLAPDGVPVPSVAEVAPEPAVVEPPPVVKNPPVGTKPPVAKRPRAKRPVVKWRDSHAIGSPNGGRLEKGVRLPAGGVGYYTYNPATQEPPGGSDRTWGTGTLVREILDLGEWWGQTYPGRSPLGIGDLSREHGGPFTGPGVGHQSHQNGRDVDIRLVRRDDASAPVGPDTYDRELTQAVVDRLLEQGASLILIGPNLDLHGPAGVVVRWPDHDDHLHVRF